LLFDASRATPPQTPDTLLTLSTPSNEPAITFLKWLSDCRTVVFLGIQPSGLSSICALDVESRKLRGVVETQRDITGFDVSSDLNTVAYITQDESRPWIDEQAKTHGVVIGSESLIELVGRAAGKQLVRGKRLVVKRNGKAPREVDLGAQISHFPDLTLSPNGRFALLRAYPVGDVPDHWLEYDDAPLQVFVRNKRPKGAALTLYQYSVVDIEAAAARPLLDAPTPWGLAYAWAPDSKSAILDSTFLPLDIEDSSERATRKRGCYIAEVDVVSGAATRIAPGDLRVAGALRLKGWDPVTGVLTLHRTETGESGNAGDAVAYEKTSDGWRAIEHYEPKGSGQTAIDVDVEEEMNTPPRLVAIQPESTDKSIVFDPNPQLRTFSLAKVEEITWSTSTGRQVKGGLYKPPGCVEGTRYPLVIQTHGWWHKMFMVDGPWTTGFAAQALAAKGIVVVQAADAVDYDNLTTAEEGPSCVASYEALVDSLDLRGLIDRNRVGLMGFSRTCYHVKCALTQSDYPWAAAAITDGVDAGYFQYIAVANSGNGTKAEYEKMNGGVPFGPAVQSWVERAPGFHLDKVRTPLRIEAIGLHDLVSEWEWFAGLSRLGKPVDFVLIPDGVHILEKPCERLISQQGNVDWFCFWLKGHEDDDPAKADQYTRWRDLRDLAVAG